MEIPTGIFSKSRSLMRFLRTLAILVYIGNKLDYGYVNISLYIKVGELGVDEQEDLLLRPQKI